jgi:outer membrane protein OmpA-like peptidoglycan-associated protein
MLRYILFVGFLFIFFVPTLKGQGVIEAIKESHLFEKKGNGCKIGTSYKKKRKSLVKIKVGQKSNTPYQYVYKSASAAPPKSAPKPTSPPQPSAVAKKETKENTAVSVKTATSSPNVPTKTSDSKMVPTKANILSSMTPEQRKVAVRDLPPTRELSPIRFISDQDEFSVVNMDSFMEALELINQGKIVLVEGHTDDLGSDDYNLKLSMKRVEKIRQLMLDAGADDNFISVIGYGEKKPIVPNNSKENREINRRIEFKVFEL